MNKQTNEFLNSNQKVYEELAELRTIKILGLTEKEIVIGRAFESTKALEIRNIKSEIMQRENQVITLPKLFGIF